MNKPKAEDHIFFIGHLEALVNDGDRGAIATLRRGLGKPPGSVREMDRYILPYLLPGLKASEEEPYYLVAALFAFWYQGRDEVVTCNGNLGKSLRLLVKEEAKKPGVKLEDVEKRIEKHLVALLNCHRDDLPHHLRQITSLLKSKEVPVNWVQLLPDIRDWERRGVQRAWARSFWAETREASAKEQDTGATAAGEAAED